jgi:LCP family protein required for cell wall assembly
MKRRNKIKQLVYYAAVLLLVLILLYSGLRILEATVLNSGSYADPQIVSKTITRDGIDYYPRRDITVMMLLGIDQAGPVTDSGTFTNPGTSDAVMLLIFDEKNETWSILQLNRDTMMDIPVLGLGGKEAGTIFAQLALAHTYGSGLEDSCLNTRRAVSNFLGGISIDYYISANMDAVAIVNDAVGGVTVTVTDDFSDVDQTIPMGQVTLRGEQALSFVRDRQNVGDQKHVSRMERHREYMEGFTEALRGKLKEGSGFVVETYSAVAPYLVSDCPISSLTAMIERYQDYQFTGVITPEGQSTVGKEYCEFYADEQKLDELVIDLFYAPKQGQ